MHTRPVWVEISRRNLAANFYELHAALQQQLAFSGEAGSVVDSTLLAVVKANAYGHGLEICAPALVAAGAEWIGVTSVEEGVEARALCPDVAILVMSGLWHGEADAILEHRLVPVVWESFHLDLLEAAALRRSMGPRSLPVHVELDTGMARQGVAADDATLTAFLQRFDRSSPLLLDGLCTHFSSPEVLNGGETEGQFARFVESIARVSSQGHFPGWIHAGSSASVLSGGQVRAMHRTASGIGARFMMRPGLALYGYAPRFQHLDSHTTDSRRTSPDEQSPSPAPRLLPVLSWKSRVASLREISAGVSVGYNASFRAARPTRLALLPAGYADGLNRLLSNRGRVLVGGKHVPIVGRISMDQTVLDVTDLEQVRIGDEVVILGNQNGPGETLHSTAWELAHLCGTIPYEVLCAIAKRVPRVVVD